MKDKDVTTFSDLKQDNRFRKEARKEGGEIRKR
jgi:hypothetical protein